MNNLEQLQKRLLKEYERNANVEVVDTKIWSLPTEVLKVDYEIATQSTMDVLMKMLLMTLKESPFRTIEEISELLLVETLFLEHLKSKMLHSGLIEEREGALFLLEKGEEQLEKGMFVEAAEAVSRPLLFSACHNELFVEDENEDFEEVVEEYRYYDQFSNGDSSKIQNENIESLLDPLHEAAAATKLIISNIQYSVTAEMSFIPCIEIHVYDKPKELLFFRVWNTVINEWDATLEQQIQEMYKIENASDEE